MSIQSTQAPSSIPQAQIETLAPIDFDPPPGAVVAASKAGTTPTPGHVDANAVARAPLAGTPVCVAPTPAEPKVAAPHVEAELQAVPAVPDAGVTLPITTPPADFRAAPPAPPVPNLAKVKALLIQGEPFAPDVAEAMEKITEQKLCAGGVVQFFAPLLPNATWTVSAAQVTKEGAHFGLSAVDRNGRLAFAMDCDLARQRGGAVELRLGNQHTDKLYRGWGLTAQIEQRTGAMLQALSQHPDSRITAIIGMGNTLTGAAPSVTNSFQQARRGYLFADTCNVVSPFLSAADKTQVHGLRVMREELLKWAFSEPSLAYNGKQLTSGQRRAMRDRLNACRFPSDFAELDLPGYTATLGNDPKPLPLGQAFMRSGRAPAWCAVRFVNAPSVRTGNGHQLMRGDSAARFLQVGQRELRYAATRREDVNLTLWRGFNSSDAEIRIKTYEVLGRSGEAGVERYLRDRRKHDPDKQARAAAKEALKMLRSEPALSA